MIKNKWLARWGISLAALIIFAGTPVLATGYYFHLKEPNFAYQADGTTKLTINTPVVQVVTGGVSSPGNAGEVRDGQIVVYTGTIGDGNVTDGQFEYMYGNGDTQAVFLRIWPDGPGADKMYGQTGTLYTSAAGQNANESPVSRIICHYKLSKPSGLDCAVSNFALSYTAETYLPSFTVSASNLKNENGINYVKDTSVTPNILTYYTSVSYEIAKDINGAADWNSPKSFASGDIKESDPANPFFVMGGWYWVRGKATNDIGSGTAGAELRFQIPLGSGAGGPYSVDYFFSKPNTGINTIAIPFDPASGITDAANTTILTVGDLIKSINTQLGGQNVTVFGWYDATKQQHVGLTAITGYDNAFAVTGGIVNPNTMNLNDVLLTKIVKNQPYQVTVNWDASKKAYRLTGTGK